mmetsp:Transcript_22633/g.57333  ORF Transcript_22633/g.57333 Transcript_22633/m.57333 type:complete len:589 (+) Transcript_22633:417-2183(+)|eukprot:CAMPEP_0178995712 /NCGR_PEP_ID=MMETSP0795-20121207/7965_1 /TAXON_ID=88552 /ORGANISM="Amoebophrya sp., Strain Ameob2" /LENGTH=588 /DNA_ID=CAMNT_0020688021 /DNA_START=339 /DNA_END=2105 /DNA_ORIENTATION=+
MGQLSSAFSRLVLWRAPDDRRERIQAWLNRNAPNTKILDANRREVSFHSVFGIATWMCSVYLGSVIWIAIFVLLAVRRLMPEIWIACLCGVASTLHLCGPLKQLGVEMPDRPDLMIPGASQADRAVTASARDGYSAFRFLSPDNFDAVAFFVTLFVLGICLPPHLIKNNFPLVSKRLERYTMRGCNKWFGDVILCEDLDEALKLVFAKDRGLIAGMFPHDFLPLACCGLHGTSDSWYVEHRKNNPNFVDPVHSCSELEEVARVGTTTADPNGKTSASNAPAAPHPCARVRIFASGVLLKIPFFNSLAYVLGCRSVTKRYVVEELKTGTKACIVPGGVAEVLWNCWYKHRLTEQELAQLFDDHHAFMTKCDEIAEEASPYKKEQPSPLQKEGLCFMTAGARNRANSIASTPSTSAVSLTSSFAGDLVQDGAAQPQTTSTTTSSAATAATTPIDRGALNLLYLKNRKGFIRLALQHKCPVVPIYCFGQQSLWKTLALEPPFFRKAFAKFVRYIGFAPVVALGLGWIPLSLPWSCDLALVIGKGIYGKNDSEEEVDRVHAEFCREIVRMGELYSPALETTEELKKQRVVLV